MRNSIALVTMAAVLASASGGCGAIFNGGPQTVTTAPGVTVDGMAGTVQLDKKMPHTVNYPDGNVCVIQSNVSVGYVVLDIFLTGLIGVVIDGVTGSWKVLKGGCPGVMGV